MSEGTLDLDHLRTWVGRTELATDTASASAVAGLAALLDHETPPWREGQLPPLGHWLHFLPRARQSQIGEDGHPRRGGFLPPVPLPRRMWAGSRLSFHAPIEVGATLERRSTITQVTGKTGSSGRMLFVTVQHEISVAGQLAIVEDQDLVYRDMPPLPSASSPSAAAPSAAASTPPPPAAPTPRADSTRVVTPDPVQLFRFSALTFNAHRIHYDRQYCHDVEGYPGLVVHGPYLATLLMDHFLRQAPMSQVTRFQFRAQRPLYDTHPFTLCLARTPAVAELWTVGPDQQVTMQASLETR